MSEAQPADAKSTVNFETFILSMGANALVHLGDVPHPETQQEMVDLALARLARSARNHAKKHLQCISHFATLKIFGFGVIFGFRNCWNRGPNALANKQYKSQIRF